MIEHPTRDNDGKVNGIIYEGDAADPDMVERFGDMIVSGLGCQILDTDPSAPDHQRLIRDYVLVLEQLIELGHTWATQALRDYHKGTIWNG